LATLKDYQTGAAAAQKIVQADINKDVPVFFRGEIPPTLVQQLAADVAKAVIDAVDAERAANQPRPTPPSPPKEQTP
jgi:hypothetical protein